MACKFDQVWIDNRIRYRKDMKGTALRLDDETGYLEPTTKRGFSAEMKKIFIQRFSVCKNKLAICKSLYIDPATVYDAIALDKKFREDYLKADSVVERSPRLNDELVKVANSAKQTVINDLTKAAEKYK